jgi:hypothetical protein
LDRYDGPRGGLADIDGAAHYFRAVHDYAHAGEPDDEYFVWPASGTAMTWEHEQWAIFVEWNTRYEAGAATPETHPGHGGHQLPIRRADDAARATPSDAGGRAPVEGRMALVCLPNALSRRRPRLPRQVAVDLTLSTNQDRHLTESGSDRPLVPTRARWTWRARSSETTRRVLPLRSRFIETTGPARLIASDTPQLTT